MFACAAWRVKSFVLDLLERRQGRAAEPRLWVFGHDGRCAESTCAPDLDRVLVAVGLAESRGAAQRLLRAGAVEARSYLEPDTWHKAAVGDKLAVGAWPVAVRVGKKFYGVKVVMAPAAYQTRWAWEREVAA